MTRPCSRIRASKISVDVAAGKHGADGVGLRKFDLARDQCRDAGGARAFNDDVAVLDAVKDAFHDLVLGNLDDDRRRTV